MRETVALKAVDVVPDRAAVLRGLGPGRRGRPSERTEALLQRALESFAGLAAPVGIYAEIAPADFAVIYRGEGANEADSPVEKVYPRAQHLALYAATVGEGVSGDIAALFASEDYALAVVLDAVASAGTEMAELRVQARFRDRLTERSAMTATTQLLNYSPGYCGWHLSGQRALFAALRPEEIGITLNASCLMLPLKSVSGVIVAGPAEAHRFEDVYPFCSSCRARDCRERIDGLAD